MALAGPAAAQYPPPALKPLTMTSEPGRLLTAERQGVFNKTPVRYDIELEETIVKDAAGRPTASLYALGYVAKGVRNPETRPVIFAFNGGPGGPAVYLNFGSLGPRIFPSGQPRTQLVDNPSSPLDAADLVFLDPPDTGYSHTFPGVDAKQFYSIDGDSEALSQVVVDWLRVHHRASAPVYLLGESYGSMRAVAMARDLMRGPAKVNVGGVILAGNSLGYFQKGQMPDVLYWANALPMEASVAWSHGKIDNKGQTWAQAVDKARLYARTKYISALMQGYRLDDETRAEVIHDLPAIIGIPESYFREKHTIVVRDGDFLRELLKPEGRVVDGDDGRLSAPAGPQERSRYFSDHARMLSTLMATDLKFTGLPDYVPINTSVSRVWNFYTAGAMALDVTLAKEMKDNPNLHVMLAQGRFDTRTTIGNSEYIMRQADLDWSRYVEVNYDGGHSMAPEPEILSAIRRFVAP